MVQSAQVEHPPPGDEARAALGGVGVSVTGDDVVVGLTGRAAVNREMGTATVPPHPFLAPFAADHAGSVAQAVGAAVADALKEG
jgi:hypothetical protein